MHMRVWGVLAVPVCFLVYYSEQMTFWAAVGMAILSGYLLTLAIDFLACASIVLQAIAANRYRAGGAFILMFLLTLASSPGTWGLILLAAYPRFGWPIAASCVVVGFAAANILGMLCLAGLFKRMEAAAGSAT